MNRRIILALIGASMPTRWSGFALAQTSSAPPHIGLLSIGASQADPANFAPFLEAMSVLGYNDGQSVVFERRFADGREDLIPGFAADLVKQGVAVIVATGPRESVAASNATKTIPIVMLLTVDPIGLHLAASLSRPGGNVTGLSTMETGIFGKRLEILKEAVPGLTKVALLVSAKNLTFRADTPWGRDREAEARALGVALNIVEATTIPEIENVVADAAAAGAHGLLIASDGDYVAKRSEFAAIALKYAMPTMFGLRQHVEVGGFMAYAPVIADLSRRGAFFVDRILKGTKPADLPIELPLKFELVINLKTAKALGLIVPPTLLAQADEVIE
jgi:putative tryptophan/tyrosine transport system substrate-binding protein